MQRSVLQQELDQNQEELQRAIDDEHWVRDLPQHLKRDDRYILQPSVTQCEHLVFGRLSFKGFNPDVEKLMKIHDHEEELLAACQREKEQSITEREMAKRYSALVGIISKKFTSKKRRSDAVKDEEDAEMTRAPKMFLKPEENS
ncbi:hypothetical protein C0Q70_18476 [Pomacea canaliculata]|uniref:M-phase phosphoprotein 6 n=2 Tax=Pomacea canaliculata TaxID=400727 RepID=A0A2T7NGQ8_POMCA|nr:hypothetical protein C0Q70_18476 [Pomacea canaliculata]